MSTQCPVCLLSDAKGVTVTQQELEMSYSCPRCGDFVIQKDLDGFLRDKKDPAGNLGTEDSRKRANASAWLYQNSGSSRLFTRKDLAFLTSLPTPSINERLEMLLLRLGRESKYFGHVVDGPITENRCYPWISSTWSVNVFELTAMFAALEAMGLIKRENASRAAALTSQGWEKIDPLSAKGADSHQVFVAMSFSPDLLPIYDEAIAPAIMDAGYRPFRVDRHEHVNRIDDEIIAQIRRSRFVVADYTQNRAGVYYEAGFAFGLGRPVFNTCRKKPDLDDIHLDVRQINCIDWTTLDELKDRLTKRIEAVIGRGPVGTQDAVEASERERVS